MQRKLDMRMEEVLARMAAKAEARPAPVVASSEDDEAEAAEAPIAIQANTHTGELQIVVKTAAIAPADDDSAAAASSPPAAELASSVQDVPAEVPAELVASTLVVEGIAALRSMWANIVALSEVGSPSEDDLELLHNEKEKAATFKQSFAAQLSSLPAAAKIESESKVEAVAQFAEELIKETDRSPGTAGLLAAVLRHVEIDWPTIIEERALGAMAACDGSTLLLEAMLAVPDVRFDLVELVCSCFFNQGVRIPLAYLILTAPQPLPLDTVRDDLQEQWQEFFEDVASNKRAIPREDRVRRLDLLQIMLASDVFTVNAEEEGPDGQSAFSRACLEGDLDVVQMLVAAKKVSDVAAVRSDGMTALHSAVIGNNVDLVRFLLQSQDVLGDIDVNREGPNGNALDLALLLQRDGKIAADLRAVGAKSTTKSGGKKPKPKGKAGVSVGFAAAKLAGRARPARK
jgi:hypothetical protein